MSVDFTIEDNHAFCRANGLSRKEMIDGEVFEFDPFSLNAANANARLILNYLGLPSKDDLCGSADPRLVLAAIGDLPHNDILVRKEVRPTPNLVFCGLSADRLALYWKELRAIATEAKRRGRKVVWS